MKCLFCNSEIKDYTLIKNGDRVVGKYQVCMKCLDSNPPYYDLKNKKENTEESDGDLISRKAVLDILDEELRSYVDYLREEIGGIYDIHLLGFTEDVKDKIKELPTIPQTFKPIAEIKVDTDEVVKEVVRQIKSGEMQLDIPQTDTNEYFLEKLGNGQVDLLGRDKKFDLPQTFVATSEMIGEKAELGKMNELTVQTDSVLEKIKEEIIDKYTENYMGEPTLGGSISLNDVLKIIDKHISGKEK